jgi:hypothetical protein
MKHFVAAGLAVTVMLLLAPAGFAEGIWYEDGRVYVDVDFTVHDFGDCAWIPAEDFWIPDAETACSWYVSWNPSAVYGGLCDRPEECADDGFEQTTFCHFKILTSDGSCLRFNSRPWLESNEAGTYDLIFSMPKEQVLNEGTISMAAESNFAGVILSGYYQEPGLRLQEGESYVLQVTEQAEGCREVVNSDDGERVIHEQWITIPVCCKGFRGDADGSGRLDALDLDYLLDYFFRGGPPPVCFNEADVNGDGQLDLMDVDYLVDYFWNGGPRPAACP